MPEFTIREVEAQPYVYAARECSMDPADISAAMGSAFGEVMAAVQAQGLAPVGPPLAVYHSYDPETLRFRAGVPVSADDAARANGPLQTDATPGGRVLFFVHQGPYRTLRVSYGEMVTFLQDNGLSMSAPTWESYVDDPAEVAEDVLRTECFCALV